MIQSASSAKSVAVHPPVFNPAFVRAAVRNLGNQAELARLLGVTKEAVRPWADARSAPSQPHIDAIAEAAHLDPDSAWLDPDLPDLDPADAARRLLANRHVTLRQIATATGIGLGTACEIRRGKRTPTADQLAKLAAAALALMPSLAKPSVSPTGWAAAERARRSIRRCTMNLSDDVIKWYGLKDDPWRLDVLRDQDVFMTADFQRMHKAITRAVERRDFLVIDGPTGSGKSQMARRLIREVTKRRKIKLVPILAPDVKQINSSTICDALVRNLAPGDRPEVRNEKLAIQVCTILCTHHAAGSIPVLVIDDAHRCTPSTLSQLKRFHEFRDLASADPYEPLIAIVLLGWPELSLTLMNNASLLEIARRADIIQLRGLRGEHADYIRQKLARVGANGNPIFDKPAVEALRKAPSSQWPLALNRICSRAMFLAWDDRKSRKPARPTVTAADIAQAAKDEI